MTASTNCDASKTNQINPRNYPASFPRYNGRVAVCAEVSCFRFVGNTKTSAASQLVLNPTYTINLPQTAPYLEAAGARRTKNRCLSVSAGTATSKKPTIISS